MTFKKGPADTYSSSHRKVHIVHIPQLTQTNSHMNTHTDTHTHTHTHTHIRINKEVYAQILPLEL